MKTFKRILVTSALPYANGPLHLGHIAGAYLPADIYVRYQKLKGRDVIFICGSDEHGVPITVTADNEGVSPQDVVDRYHAMNKESFEKLGIQFDHYSRTSLPIHHQTAREFFRILHEKGDFVIKSDEQFYSDASMRFLPDRYVEGICPHCGYDKARGDQCDRCGKWLEPKELIEPRSKIDGSRPVLKKTQHWYFPMGRFAGAWKDWFDGHRWKENVQNYCIGWYNEGLGDRPITRDLHWGVPVPLKEAEGKVLYVWFDAPIGYISSTKEWAVKVSDPERWKMYWCDPETKLVHFIGKDNIVFHAILFPMMLMEVGGYVLPEAIPANEYLTIEGRKISTSQNYAIWLKDYLEMFPSDPLRYALAANAPETKDTDFSWGQFQSRNNDELADILGNFINRTLTFIHRYCGGKAPAKGNRDERDLDMLDKIQTAGNTIGECFENFQVRNAVKHLMDFCRSANKYFNDQASWETRVSDFSRCETTMNVCLQVTRAIAILMAPILPEASTKLTTMLKMETPFRWDDIGKDEIPEEYALGKPEILFDKIEDDIIRRETEKLKGIERETHMKSDEQERIDMGMFQKVDLRTGKIVEADRIEGTDKLLKARVDLGDEERQIVVGVADSYSPSQIVGKTVIVVANLKSAKIRGVESQGMILAVQSGSGYTLLTTDGEAESGTRVE
ncbi:MAG: methionine--tRNA ligase [bacterium]